LTKFTEGALRTSDTSSVPAGLTVRLSAGLYSLYHDRVETGCSRSVM